MQCYRYVFCCYLRRCLASGDAYPAEKVYNVSLCVCVCLTSRCFDGEGNALYPVFFRFGLYRLS